jgi:class 3 adenylate cyclase
MTQDETIEMAREAGFVITYIGDPIGTNYAMLEAFAKLVDAKATTKEREACANLMFEIDLCGREDVAFDTIRNRGEV